MGEEIFIKEQQSKKKTTTKPKKTLSQAQLDGLAKGRARMAEKRALKKATAKQEKEEVDKELQKKDLKAVKESKTLHKEERKIRMKHIKEDREQKLKEKWEKDKLIRQQEAEEKRNKEIERFSNLKYGIMETAKSEQEYNDFKSIMDKVDDNMIMDKTKLYSYLETSMKQFQVPTAKSANPHKENLQIIMEEQRE